MYAPWIACVHPCCHGGTASALALALVLALALECCHPSHCWQDVLLSVRLEMRGVMVQNSHLASELKQVLDPAYLRA